jgi:hypothetical protein
MPRRLRLRIAVHPEALSGAPAAFGLTEPPPPERLGSARAEGWIHLPRKGSLGELAVDGRS